ncbi:hypothetical protein Tco_0387064 [Tanacetum coccineum]
MSSLPIHQEKEENNVDAENITFLGSEPIGMEDDSDSGLHFMPDDDLSDPLGHHHEELRTLNTKVDQLESSISKKVTDDIQSSIPSIVVNALKANLPGLLSEALKNTHPQMIKDLIQQSVQESIKEKLSLFDAQV